jgi:hypothetical protein
MLLVGGCMADGVVPNAKLACGGDKECPGGYRCVTHEGRSVCCKNGDCGGGGAGGTGGGAGGQAGIADAVPDSCGSSDDVNDCGWCGNVCLGPKRGTGQAVCRGGACDITCTGGQSRCGDECVDLQGDGLHCASCTMVCAAGRVCRQGACELSCGASQKACSGSCVDPSTNPDHCGDCGRVCTRPTGGGTATCQMGTCGIQCLMGFHPCAGTTQCAADGDSTRCGSNCVSCPGIAFGDPICEADTCGVTCRSGYVLCGGACRDRTSLDSCGTQCQSCQVTGDRAIATCDGNSCGFTCKSNAPKCTDGSCSRLLWSFDSGSVDGVFPRAPAGLQLAVRNFNGDPALAADVNQLTEISFNVPICLSSAIDLRTRTLSFRVFFDGTPTPAGNFFIQASAPQPQTNAYLGQLGTAGSGMWTTYSEPLSKSTFSGSMAEVTIQAGTYGAQFSGTVYFDDIRIQ